MTLRSDVCGAASVRDGVETYPCGLQVATELVESMTEAQVDNIDFVHQRHHDQRHTAICQPVITNHEDGSQSISCGRECFVK